MSTHYACPYLPTCSDLKYSKNPCDQHCCLNESSVKSHTLNPKIHTNCNPDCPAYGANDMLDSMRRMLRVIALFFESYVFGEEFFESYVFFLWVSWGEQEGPSGFWFLMVDWKMRNVQGVDLKQTPSSKFVTSHNSFKKMLDGWTMMIV
ncbi:uncharacterized protein PGTG_19098 [Puccinia graminis f. sp. tritici CRL 75-36-700-3]|uniref:Uncharacterized protein n=1 Tax=Puccinia graminis f. sp. tritici (strain CRL 75-36-700-3 / race SCCL) TaxID=418459 RepID=E3L9Y0_PUCGT|nr:uncharacterized protein PGTG_19098 [Puccinia graminis f. sp. tritici CRL 75-36-700-3]EFP93365.1 hypothetical protein PGTG_19098 [Puccinia graminis f. sp. tritici CRL 75-36-700-3]